MENLDSKIQSILEDLYNIDPSLKQYESDIKKIIQELLLAKPDTKFDQIFAENLRRQLITKTKEANSKSTFKKLSLTNPSTFQNTQQLAGGRNKAEGLPVKSNTSKEGAWINFKFMKKPDLAFLAIAVLALILGGFYAGQKQERNKQEQTIKQKTETEAETLISQTPIGSQEQQKIVSQVKKFASKEEFVNYLANAQASGYGYGIGGGSMVEERALSAPSAAVPDSLGDMQKSQITIDSAGRISQTNVQVLGIDEPDIVKTDGKNIYLSTDRPYYRYMEMDVMPNMPGSKSILPPQQTQNTEIITAFPPKDLKKLAKIDKQGDLLLYKDKDILIIFSGNYIYGYNIKDAANPKEVWKIKLENNGYLTAARLYNGKLFLVTRNYPDFQNPCPIKPLTVNDRSVEIPCSEIYHPIVPVSDVSTYYAFAINPETGEINNKLSFVGSSGTAIVYMSENSLYISYTYLEDPVKIFADFLKTKASDVFPSSIVAKIEKLQTYDISSNAKMVEFQQIMEKYFSSLDRDEQVKKQNELENRMNDYLKEHKRSLLFTGIVKIPLDKFEITATGNVPGTPLNQFSLDEYQNHLRIATTVGGQNIGMWGGWRGQDTANDVYVLDKNLKITGKIEDLGLTEKIYSARFVEDTGFLVTFRQIDPFYVLDLSDVKNPKMKGELKIPGYSSYLHPLATNKILGVGMESGKVKLSLFDVSNPSSPKELDKYSLDEYWSDVNSTHHAFLQDKDHQIFFLPGGQNGYVFSYKNDKLKMEKAISQIQAKRALYIQDFLYIIGSDKIVVVDENTWERVNEMEL